MTKPALLLVNFTNRALARELGERGYDLFTANMKRSLDLQMVDGKFDLIYFAYFYPQNGIDMVFPKVKTPFIYAFHAPSIIFNPYRPSNYLYNIASSTKILSMKIAKPTTTFHVLSIDEYRLHKALGLPSCYEPLGVDTELFNLSDKSDRFTVVFVGARYQKGVDMLSRIVPKVLEKQRNIKFILVAGQGFLNEYLYSLANAYEDNVEVYEYLPQAELARIFSRSHVLLFPSRWESFGLVVLEALGCGTPVVGFDISGAMRDVVKRYKAGTTARFGDMNELAEGIAKYYRLWKEDPVEFSSLSEYLRSIALRYDWKIVAEMFDETMLSTLLKPCRAGRYCRYLGSSSSISERAQEKVSWRGLTQILKSRLINVPNTS